MKFTNRLRAFQEGTSFQVFLLSVLITSLSYGLYKGMLDNYLAEVVKMGEITALKDVSSAVIRICRERKGIAEDVIAKLLDERRFPGTLILSPPGVGKTTFLRSAAYLLSTGKGINPTRVGLADERCELSAGICKDAGCQSIAVQIVILGKIVIMTLGASIIFSLIELINMYLV